LESSLDDLEDQILVAPLDNDVTRISRIIAQLETLAHAPRFVGVGETGLDHHYDHSPREAQAAAFRRFVGLALRVRRPVICHIRDAHPEATAILREERAADAGGVIHCFTGNVEDSRAYLDLGFYLSFSGILTFKNAEEIRQAAVFAPLDRVLVETDAPYLAPIPHLGRRNEPAFVVETLKLLAQLKGLDFEAAAETTTRNARRAFALPETLVAVPGP
jgi:TatD DNase family protein